MCAEECIYLRARTTRPAKVTLISSQQAAAYYDPDKSAGAYPTRDAYLADVVDLTRREVDELVAPRLHLHPDRRAPVRGAARPDAARGLPAARQRSRPADRRVHRDGQRGDRRRTRASPSACTSAAATTSRCSTPSGGYEPIARVFGRSRFERFLLEYDDERSGGFEPLRAVPDDRTVVLGLVTTKKPAPRVGGRAARAASRRRRGSSRSSGWP